MINDSVLKIPSNLSLFEEAQGSIGTTWYTIRQAPKKALRKIQRAASRNGQGALVGATLFAAAFGLKKTLQSRAVRAFTKEQYTEFLALAANTHELVKKSLPELPELPAMPQLDLKLIQQTALQALQNSTLHQVKDKSLDLLVGLMIIDAIYLSFACYKWGPGSAAFTLASQIKGTASLGKQLVTGTFSATKWCVQQTMPRAFSASKWCAKNLWESMVRIKNNPKPLVKGMVGVAALYLTLKGVQVYQNPKRLEPLINHATALKNVGTLTAIGLPTIGVYKLASYWFKEPSRNPPNRDEEYFDAQSEWDADNALFRGMG